jgi:VanZ family protein
MRFFQKSVLLIAWLLFVFITVLSLAPPEFRPETGAPRDFEHLAIFAACGFAFGLGCRRRPHLVMAALVLFAGAIELAQTLIPGRHAHLSDFIVDAVAISVSAAVAILIGLRVLDPNA